jgi:hypothetical protein
MSIIVDGFLDALLVTRGLLGVFVPFANSATLVAMPLPSDADDGPWNADPERTQLTAIPTLQAVLLPSDADDVFTTIDPERTQLTIR